MPMKNPSHPGEVIRGICMEPFGLTVTEAAQGLGVTRKTLSALLNGHAAISPEMAIRLSHAFGRSPEGWLALQALYDLAQLRDADIQVTSFKEWQFEQMEKCNEEQDADRKMTPFKEWQAEQMEKCG